MIERLSVFPLLLVSRLAMPGWYTLTWHFRFLLQKKRKLAEARGSDAITEAPGSPKSELKTEKKKKKKKKDKAKDRE